MAKEKACTNCKRIYEPNKSPSCGHTQSSDSFKGKIFIFNAKESEMANNMKITKEGQFAIKTK
jgi:RNA polymerase subunit RPABC4/transcription elongation factor Spt4